MAGALDQAECSTPFFGGSLEGLHDLIDKLQQYQGPIYVGGGGAMISNQGGGGNFFENS